MILGPAFSRAGPSVLTDSTLIDVCELRRYPGRVTKNFVIVLIGIRIGIQPGSGIEALEFTVNTDEV